MGLLGQLLNPQDNTPTERGICQKCGSDYEPYVIAVMDNFVAISDYVQIQEEWEWLCRDCLDEEMRTGKYATWDDPHYE